MKVSEPGERITMNGEDDAFLHDKLNRVHEIAGSPMDPKRGPVQQISNGRWVYPLDMKPEDIFIDDITEALSKICRYIGHTKEFYSVAQHSVIVSKLVSQEHALWGLLHDATEAYIGDITKPIKRCLESIAPGAFYEMEVNIEKAIADHFHLPWPMPDTVKIADVVVLATEKRDLLFPSDLSWGPLPEPMAEVIVPWIHEEAKEEFQKRYELLKGCQHIGWLP